MSGVQEKTEETIWTLGIWISRGQSLHRSIVVTFVLELSCKGFETQFKSASDIKSSESRSGKIENRLLRKSTISLLGAYTFTSTNDLSNYFTLMIMTIYPP